MMDSTVTADPAVLFVHVVRMTTAPRTSTATSTFRPVERVSGGVTPTASVAMETSAREGSARSESAEDIGTVLVTRHVIIRALPRDYEAYCYEGYPGYCKDGYVCVESEFAHFDLSLRYIDFYIIL